jgi:histidinol phosphatase-like PHP family hydrolase
MPRSAKTAKTKKTRTGDWPAPPRLPDRDRPGAEATAAGARAASAAPAAAPAPAAAEERPASSRELSRPDTNFIVAALLRDLATIQDSRQRQWGYKGAAAAIFNLDQPLEALLRPDGTFERIPGVGPSSTRIALDVIRTGGSAAVEDAVQKSRKADDIARRRALRSEFFSRARVKEILNADAPGAVTAADLRADFQMHSVWSDGGSTIEEMAAACEARGYDCCAVTDHAHGLRIARGMSTEDMRRQHREIAALNGRLEGRFRVLKSIEANIQADGTLDVEPTDLESLDLVVAAPHASLRSLDDQTIRMLTAIATPGVHVLAHPTGRKSGDRAGIVARWNDVFRAAAMMGVAIEIDGDPSRQDVNWTMAAQALEAGCLFSLDSDAHSPDELVYAETAVAHARLAGIPPSRIINCWTVADVLQWAAHAWTR